MNAKQQDRIHARQLLRRSPDRRRNGWRTGGAILELVMAFQAMLWLSFGMVEFGQYFYIKHAFEAAARDGARYAVLPTATQTATISTITSTLSQANVTFNSSWLTITDINTSSTVSDISTVTAGDAMQFSLSTTYSSIANAVRPLYSMTGKGIGSGKLMTAQCTMLKE